MSTKVRKSKALNRVWPQTLNQLVEHRDHKRWINNRERVAIILQRPCHLKLLCALSAALHNASNIYLNK